MGSDFEPPKTLPDLGRERVRGTGTEGVLRVQDSHGTRGGREGWLTSVERWGTTEVDCLGEGDLCQKVSLTEKNEEVGRREDKLVSP